MFAMAIESELALLAAFLLGRVDAGAGNGNFFGSQ